MRRRESLVGQVVAVNVLLVVAVVFAASATAGLNLAVNDQRLRFGALAISILLLLIINMILLRRRFSPLETLIARLEEIDPAQPTTQFVVPRTTVEEVERLATTFRRLLRRRRMFGRFERQRWSNQKSGRRIMNPKSMWILGTSGAPELTEDIAELKTLVNQAMEELLRLARQLRPASLDDMGLIAALEGQIARFGETTSIEASFHHEGAPEALTEDQQTVIYRVVQEALSNTAQHSEATFVDFDLRVFPSHGVELRVRDNGKGFEASQTPDAGGIGLSGMAERARLVGGELTVTSSPGSGTRVRLYIPQ